MGSGYSDCHCIRCIDKNSGGSFLKYKNVLRAASTVVVICDAFIEIKAMGWYLFQIG